MVSYLSSSSSAQATLAVLVLAVAAAIVAGCTPVQGAIVVLVLAGLVSGFLAGLLGIGGALVTIPALYLALPRLGVPAADVSHVAVSTALIAMLPTTLAAACCHRRSGAVHAGWLGRLAPGMAVGALCGALLACQLRGVALALVFAAQSLWYGGRLVVPAGPPGSPPGRTARLMACLPPWFAGPPMGAFCACVGMGGGSMVNPYLTSHGLDLRGAVATSSALNVCIAIGGSIVFCSGTALQDGARGPSWLAAALLGAAAVATIPAGVALARRIALARYRFLVGAINIAGGISLIAHAL